MKLIDKEILIIKVEYLVINAFGSYQKLAWEIQNRGSITFNCNEQDDDVKEGCGTKEEKENNQTVKILIFCVMQQRSFIYCCPFIHKSFYQHMVVQNLLKS